MEREDRRKVSGNVVFYLYALMSVEDILDQTVERNARERVT